jgi:hypothetical protein
MVARQKSSGRVMTTQEKELVKTENESCSSGSCSTSDAKAVSARAEELKKAQEQKLHSEKSGGGCCG